MGQQIKQKQMSGTKDFIFFMGIVLIAVNLRPAITSVGPLIGTIRDDIGFHNWSVALLTSLPLIAFAIMSPIVPKLANRLTNSASLVVGLCLLIVGIGLRSISAVFLLFLGTFLVGLGIAICNVLLPSVIKEKFPHKIALMTGVYTSGMAVFATTASGLSIPLAVDLGFGWQMSLIVWVVPAFAALFIWLWLVGKTNKLQTTAYLEKRNTGIWKSSLAWYVALFMGLQSLIFYVMISWLAEILIGIGMTQMMAGFMVAYFQLLGIPVSFIVPILAVKLRSQGIFVLVINLLYVFGICLLLYFPSFKVVLLSVAFIGIATSANFALALTFLSIRARTAKHAAALSGMAQSIGYILAACGPVTIGFIHDVTKGWTMPLYFLLIITAAIMVFGAKAGQNKYVLNTKGDKYAKN